MLHEMKIGCTTPDSRRVNSAVLFLTGGDDASLLPTTRGWLVSRIGIYSWKLDFLHCFSPKTQIIWGNGPI